MNCYTKSLEEILLFQHNNSSSIYCSISKWLIAIDPSFLTSTSEQVQEHTIYRFISIKVDHIDNCTITTTVQSASSTFSLRVIKTNSCNFSILSPFVLDLIKQFREQVCAHPSTLLLFSLFDGHIGPIKYRSHEPHSQ